MLASVGVPIEHSHGEDRLGFVSALFVGSLRLNARITVEELTATVLRGRNKVVSAASVFICALSRLVSSVIMMFVRARLVLVSASWQAMRLKT